MTFDDFSIKLFEFLKKRDAEHLNNLLDQSKKHFIDSLRLVDEACFSSFKSVPGKGADKKNKVVDIIEKRIQQSASDVAIIINGKKHCGQTKLYHYLFDKPELTCLVIDKNESFYRMRSARENGYDFFDNSGMFVINYTKENLLGQYRFNRQGIPALYVADHLYGCWEETRRPDLLRVNCCRITNVSEMRVLRLYIDNAYTSIEGLLLAWLAMVCSYNVNNDKNKFKFEYAVPNIILDMMRYHNNECKDDKKIHGIKYLSSKYQFTDEIQFAGIKSLFYNYVFPSMEDFMSKSKGDDLKTKFKVTKGFSLTFYQIHSLDFMTQATWTSSYSTSIFHAMEQQLKKEKAEYVKG